MKCFYTGLFLFYCCFAFAQYVPLDGTYNPNTAPDSFVVCGANYNSGRVLVGGSFNNIGGVARNKIAMIYEDGSIDNSFVPLIFTPSTVGPIFQLKSIAVQANGKILVAGPFSAYGGVSVQKLIRLNSDGSRDPSFNITYIGYFNPSVVMALPTGKIFVGGNQLMLILNDDGSVYKNLSEGITFSLFDVLNAKVSTSGEVHVCGNIQATFGSQTYTGILRFTDTYQFDPNFSTQSINYIQDIEVLVSGKILYRVWNYIRRLNVNGSNDATFTQIYSATTLSTFKLLPDGKILYSGDNVIKRASSSGIIEPNFMQISGGANQVIIHPKSGWFILGNFTHLNNQYSRNLVVYNPVTMDQINYVKNLAFGSSGPVFKVVGGMQSSKKAIIAGDFTHYNLSSVQKIVRLKENGHLDFTFNPGIGPNNTITCLAVQADDKIIIGGNFTSYNGVSRNGLARLNADGSLDLSFNAPGLGLGVKTIKVQNNGKIMIAGKFTWTGFTSSDISRLNTDGTPDLSFNVGTGASISTNLGPAIINDFAVDSNYNYYVVGLFNQLGGVNSNYIIKLNQNGNVDASFTSQCGTNYNNGNQPFLSTILIQPNGKLMVGGLFPNYAGSFSQNIRRMDTTGVLDLTFAHNVPPPTHIFNDETNNFFLCLGGGIYYSYFKKVSSTGGTIFTNLLNGPEDVNPIGRQSFNKYILAERKYSNDISVFRYTGCAPITITQNLTVCDSLTWLNGFTYHYSIYGKKHVSYSNTTCDTTYVLNLTIQSSEKDIIIYSCDSLVWVDGNTYFNNNYTASHTLTTAAGCDSVLNLKLTISSPTFTTQTFTACDSFTWINGITYFSSNNTASHVVPSSVFCDSTYILNLTINNSYDTTITIDACNSFYFANTGLTYYNNTIPPPDYYGTTTGCDSIINYNIVIHQPQNITQTYTACDSFTWINGVTYFTSNNIATQLVVNPIFCDTTYHLNLTIVNSIQTTEFINACASYTWINGVTYTSSNNTDSIILSNQNGCDSIVYLDLTIENNTTEIFNTFSLPSDTIGCNGAVAIEVFGNPNFDISIDSVGTGISTSSYALVQNLCPGIHSVSAIDLCIDTTSVLFVIPIDTNFVYINPFLDSIAVDSLGVTLTNCLVYYNSIDTAFISSIVSSGNNISVVWNIVDINGSNYDTVNYSLNNGSGVYWLQLSIFCPVKSMNGQFFTITEAIYFDNGYISIAVVEEVKTFIVSVFPNPFDDAIIIKGDFKEAAVTIYESSGKKLEEINIIDGSKVDFTDYAPGVYFLKIIDGNQLTTKRVIKN